MRAPLTSTLLASLATLIFLTSGPALERHPDPELAELNDYLMALQVLRHGEPGAESLFQDWQVLRTASWRIRELTDDEGLPIDAPGVVAQIQRTRELRQALLDEARAYFEAQSNILPTARVHVGERLTVAWPDTLLSAAVGSRRLVLIELTSSGPDPARLTLTGPPSDQILFWTKAVSREP